MENLSTYVVKAFMNLFRRKITPVDTVTNITDFIKTINIFMEQQHKSNKR